MSDVNSGSQESRNTLIDRLVGSVPAQYREEVSRVANRIRDRLPPVMVEHRIDALERHVDQRLAEIEAKVDEILRRLDKP
jgi:hypothetical protein